MAGTNSVELGLAIGHGMLLFCMTDNLIILYDCPIDKLVKWSVLFHWEVYNKYKVYYMDGFQVLQYCHLYSWLMVSIVQLLMVLVIL